MSSKVSFASTRTAVNPTTEDHVDWRRELLDAGIDLFELPSRRLNTEDGQNLACDVSEDSISHLEQPVSSIFDEAVR